MSLKSTLEKAEAAFRTKNPKMLLYLAALLATGVALLFFSGRDTPGLPGMAEPAPAQESATPPATSANTAPAYHYERALEARLAATLSQVAGAGQVQVLVALERGTVQVFAADRSTSHAATQEQDAQGGTRHQTNYSVNEQHLLVQNQPVVLESQAPVVGGVIIIAEGGGNVHVQDALLRATTALLGIGAHRVQVLPMAVAQNSTILP